MNHSLKTWISGHWLILLIAAQPLLDALAFWTANERATAAGFIRLAIMALLPLWLLLRGKGRKPLLIGLGVMALYSLLHVLNGFRVGYINPVFDVQYLIKVLQMPVLALCFVILIRERETKDQAFRGLLLSAGITLLLIVLARLTGTGNVTYGEGLGYSGWVISDNRTANSILLVTLGCFAVGWAVRGDKMLWQLAVPLTVTAVYLSNGTKACYFSLYLIFGLFALFLLLCKAVHGEKVKRFAVLVLALLLVFATAVYPLTPRARVSAAIAKTAQGGEIEATLAEMGYDVTKMSFEERYNNPEVKEVFEYYYYRYFIGVLPDIFDRFGMDSLLRYFRMTTDAARLIDTRQIKIAYSALLWQQECDWLTHLVGFEVSQIGFDGTHDLENDWPALFFYYGYLGCALYVAFVLYFLYLVFRRLRENFKASVTCENVTLVMALLLQLGLAQFSGALLRRPNVSVYLALILALIYYAARRAPEEGRA